MLSSAEEEDGMLTGLSLNRPTIGAAKILVVWSDLLPHTIAYVAVEDIEISSTPKENDFVKEYLPHLFEK
jgi:hypothetical protein